MIRSQQFGRLNLHTFSRMGFGSWSSVLLWAAAAAASAAIAAASSSGTAGAASEAELPDVRPPQNERTFQSTAINGLITTLVPLMKNKDFATLLSNCLPNTLDTTVYYSTSAEEAGNEDVQLDTFIITGVLV